MRPEHDESIDRTLAALREAQPPEGLQARVLGRLTDQHSVVPHPASWRDRIAGLVPSAAWLRGAATGAAVTAVALGALLFAIRMPRLHPAPQTDTAAQASAPQPAHASPVNFDAVACSPVTIPARVLSTSRDITVTRPLPQTARTALLRDASFAPSHPAPPAPLTAQERALVQLVRTATPAQLAALSPAAEEKTEAKRQADFDKFFAPSAEVRAIDDAQKKTLGLSNDESAIPTPSKEGQL